MTLRYKMYVLCGSNGDTRRRRKKPSPTDQTTCAICFEAVISEIKTLPCQHKFHFQCITKWIQVSIVSYFIVNQVKRTVD
jgi:hypothetical protein